MDFVAASKAEKNDTGAASNWAKAAAGLAIIGVILLIVGLIVGFVFDQTVSTAVNFAKENPELVQAALL